MYAVDFARHLPGVSVVSMSWGSGEFGSEKAYDSIFTTPAGHNGVTFVAASGDSGAYSGAQWPASSPNVVAVGGTSLYVNAVGTTVFEAAWSGSGGGYSVLESEPSFQRSVQGTGRRSTPDVSMDADPNTGVAVVLHYPGERTRIMAARRRHQPVGAALRRRARRGRSGPRAGWHRHPRRRNPDFARSVRGLIGELPRCDRRLQRLCEPAPATTWPRAGELPQPRL